MPEVGTRLTEVCRAAASSDAFQSHVPRVGNYNESDIRNSGRVHFVDQLEKGRLPSGETVPLKLTRCDGNGLGQTCGVTIPPDPPT